MKAATVVINGVKHVLVQTRRKLYNFTQAYKVRGIEFLCYPECKHALISINDLKKLIGQVDREHWSLSVDTYEATRIINGVVLDGN